MMDEVVIIAPELSPAAGGVGDYTLRLLNNWPNAAGTRILVAQPGPGLLPYRIAQLGGDQAAIEAQLPKGNGRVLVQYSAYGFDRHGFPGKLIRALVNWKQSTGGRLVIMFHEIWTFWPVTNKNYFVQLLHRRAIKRLLKHADDVFTSTQSQAAHLQELSPERQIRLLPVGSNIRRCNDIDLTRNRGSAVIFGRQATRVRALIKINALLVSLARAGALSRIVSVGAGEDATEEKEERALLAALPLREGFEQRGQRPEAEISELLLTASFGIFAQGELSIAKSGTFMAYAAHELNVLTDIAGQSKPEPICWLVSPEELLGGISGLELKKRAEALLAWQRQVSSWKGISENFSKALDLEPRGSSRVGAASV
jgi:hypothetical protein